MAFVASFPSSRATRIERIAIGLVSSLSFTSQSALAISTVVQELFCFGRSRAAAIGTSRPGRSPRMIGQYESGSSSAPSSVGVQLMLHGRSLGTRRLAGFGGVPTCSKAGEFQNVNSHEAQNQVVDRKPLRISWL
jgi:hypothetical protein